jgi:uncharacterized membrane protein
MNLLVDQGGFRVSYRNRLGGNRVAFMKVAVRTADEARQALIQVKGYDFDETPLRIERINTNGVHTDTWTCDDAFDGCLYHTYMKGAV